MKNHTVIRISPDALLNAIGLTDVDVSLVSVRFGAQPNGDPVVLVNIEGVDVPPNAPECRLIAARIQSHLRPIR